MPNELYNFLKELYYAKTPQEVYDAGYYDKKVTVTFDGKSFTMSYDQRVCAELISLYENYGDNE